MLRILVLRVVIVPLLQHHLFDVFFFQFTDVRAVGREFPEICPATLAEAVGIAGRRRVRHTKGCADVRVADFEGLRDELAAQSFVRSISRELKLAMRTMQRGLEVRLHCLKIGGKYIDIDV